MMGIDVGSKVKIEDIGPLATVVQSEDEMVELEMEGERFWIPEGLVEVVWKEVA